MATFNIQLPNVRQLDWNDRGTQRQLLDFFNELVEKLNYTLNNLDYGNFDKVTYQDLSTYGKQASSAAQLVTELQQASAEESVRLYNELRDMIIEKADEVTQEYTSLFNSSDEKLQSVYSLVTDAVGENASLEEAWTSSFTQTAEGLYATVSRVDQVETTANDNLTSYQSTVASYLTFDTNGLSIQDAGSDFKTLMSSSRLSFYQGTTEVAYISGNQLYINEAQVNGNLTVDGRIITGYLEWVQETNGSYSLRKRVTT